MSKADGNGTDALKAKLLAKPKQTPIPAKDFLSTGSTLLNLALTGKPNCGFAKGHIYLMVGDSSSGKTFLSMQCLAEACKNPEYKKYRFIHDNPEGGALMDVSGFFGAATARRIEPPAGTAKDPKFSWTVEQFFRHAAAAMAKGPVVYLLDSMDALPPEADIKKAKKDAAARSAGREEKGSFGMAKAKAIRQGMRLMMEDLHRTGSIFIFIFQTTQRVGPGATYDPKTKGGGTAPTFFATHELWSSVRGAIKTRARADHLVQIGAVSRIKVKKNRVIGRPREVDVPFFYSSGFDDTGGCVDYLVEWGHWQALDKKEAGRLYQGRIVATEWGVTLKREALVRHVEEHGLETELRAAVTQVWNEVEAECAVARKPRYTT